MSELDQLHVSLDAATKETFRKLKNPNEQDKFDEILKGIKEITSNNKLASVGLGFVVTKINMHEVEDFIRLAEDHHVEFVRFKIDIRPVNKVHPDKSWK